MKKKYLKIFLLTIPLLVFNNLINAQCSTGNNDQTGTQAGGSGRWSQSFQASCTGDLNNLKVYGSRDVSGITVTIYEGDGFSGTVLGSVGAQSITQTTAYTDAEYSTFDLSSANISLIGGDTYTFDLSTGDYHYDETPSPNYSGGTLYYNTVQYTSYDVLFEVNMTLTKAYVNINATGNNDGTSWANAFTNLQDAIDTTATDGEIWVAAGTYVPTASPDDVSIDTRDYAFHVDKNLKIYGRFAGTETLLTERTTGNTTILSGDLDNNDDISDNAYHVFITNGLASTSIIDGFTITKGNANGVTSIIFSGETFEQRIGAGMYNINSSLTVSNSIFESNTSTHTGGALFNGTSSISLSDVTFSNNSANYGAGIYNSVSSPTITNSTFYNNNSAVQGGGIENFFFSSPTLTNVVFANNNGNTKGGAIYNNNNCSPTLNNTTLYNNTTNGTGAGIYNENSSNPTVNNSVFYLNTANSSADDVFNNSSTPTGNNNASDFTNAPGITVTLSSNPFFNTVDVDGADAIFGTSDDGLRLIGNSTLVDAGNNTYNAESSDISGRTRINNTTIDIGAYESYSYVWTGATDNDWDTTTNWDKGNVPTTSIDVFIPAGLTNYPTATSAVVFNNMTLDSGATFIPENTVTGTVTYKRNIPTTNWHLVASPVAGETIEDVIANHTFATGTGSNIGLASFSNSWLYSSTSSTGNMEAGKGYSVKLATAGDLSFTGTLSTSNVSYIIYNGANSFNAVGNPFTAYINSATFTTDNTALLFEETIWMWDGTQYVTYNNLSPIEIAPGQAFFVEAQASNPAIFNVANRSHQASDTFMRQEPLANIELQIESEEKSSTTKIFYVNGKTTGFDNGADSKMFGGATYDFAVFTELVTDNEGDQLAIQALPKGDTSTIPVGIIADAGKELTFSIATVNLSEDTEVYLEDKTNGTYTNLTETDYTTTLEETAKGTGQFYLHTAAKSLSTDDLLATNISIYKSNSNELTINGLASEATVTVFSLLGKQIVKTSIDNTVNKIKLPTVSAGVYIVKLTSENREITKKITL